jgi:hypothetical protein
MFIKKTLFFCCFLLVHFWTKAQFFEPHRSIVLTVNADTMALDSLTVVPNTIKIPGYNNNDFELIQGSSKVVFSEQLKGKEIVISYQVFPVDFNKTYFNKSQKKYLFDNQNMVNPFAYTPAKSNFKLIEQEGISKSGSISRGVAFGNNQDLSVNSSLNLQLSGKVTDNVNILAAITDDNIPIQADGSTNQLQDFDKIYIQLFNDKTTFTAGDFQLKSSPSHYLKYFKKGQGAHVEHQQFLDEKEKYTLKLGASGSISRGKYARNIFFGTEGNQGPYRLNGAENERFIVILSGTELVYIDGRLLTRGQEFDYIIDYNTAEIIFTTKQLITKDKRIVVEFQYTDRNYARSMFHVNSEIFSEKLDLGFQFYTEQDAKYQSLQQELTDEQITLMQNVGDSIHQAVTSSFYEVPFSNDFVLYKLVIDSITNDSIFVFSTNADSAKYRVNFSLVGQGQGSYSLLNSLANGKVYHWVGKGNGAYEPIALLITPKKRQMAVVNGKYKISESTKIIFETALSNNDINTFSKKDSQNNDGAAMMFALENKKKIVREITLISKLNYEMVSKDFTDIERFRTVEFNRDWGLGNVIFNEHQHISGVNLELMKKQWGSVLYGFDYYAAGNEFNASKNKVHFLLNNSFLKADLLGSVVSSDGINGKNLFYRTRGYVIKPLNKIELGGRTDFENNVRKLPTEENLSPLSYAFNEWEVFVQSSDSIKNKYHLGYTQREDYTPVNDGFEGATLGRNISFSMDLIKNPKNTLKTKTTYRTLAILDTNITSITADSSLINRIEYGFNLFKGAISSSSFYEIGSGMELRKDFTYIQVPLGQGIYIHNDNNNNGIKELDEFEIAPNHLKYLADFIRVQVPSSEYVKSFKNEFYQSIIIRPKAIWGSQKKGVKGFLNRFSNQYTYRIDRKTTDENNWNALNPFLLNIQDTILLSQNVSMRNNLSFNRTSAVFGVDFNIQNSRSKVLLVNGFEERKNEFIELKPRWNVNRKFRLNVDLYTGKKSNFSDLFVARNFNIHQQKGECKLTYQPSNIFRLALKYNLDNKLNDSETKEKATINRVGAELKISSVNTSVLIFEIDYFNIVYPYQTNNSLAFEMLEGLNAGSNITWFASYQRTLANNLQININYNGRWSKEVGFIHVGGVQARAFF